MPRPAHWIRKMRRGRVELYLSDGTLHVHIRGPARRARAAARELKPWLEELPEEVTRDRRYSPAAKAGAEPGDPEAQTPGQRRLVEEPET